MKTSDRLARLAAPLERQPWQGLMLLAATLLAVAILQAPNLVAANTSDHGLWLAPWLMWAVCCGVMHGLGFHPRSLIGRARRPVARSLSAGSRCRRARDPRDCRGAPPHPA